MSLTEMTLNVPVEHMANVFGQFDSYIKKIERALNVTIVIRDGTMKFLGEDANIKSAANVFSKLIELSRREMRLPNRMWTISCPLRDQ